MKRVREEACACLRAAGLPWEPDELYTARTRAGRGTNVKIEEIEGNRGSSWQSLKRGRGTIESDFLNGEVVLLGRIHGIPTPFNAVFQRIANEMARKGQQPGLYTAEELFALAMEQGSRSEVSL